MNSNTRTKRRRTNVAMWVSSGVLAGVASAQPNTIGVIVDGREVQFGSAPPQSERGRVLVPLRAVFEALGATVGFDPGNGTVTGTRGNRRVELQIGATLARIDGRAVQLDVTPQAPGGRVLVPLRFVSEAFGARVTRISGDARTGQTIFISTGNATGGLPPVRVPQPNPVLPPTTPAQGATEGDVVGTVVKSDLTPPATLTVRVNNRLQVLPIAENALIYRRFTGPVRVGVAPQFGTPLRATLQTLAPGEEVRATLDNDGNATQIVALASVQLARAAFAQDNRIVLNDANDTVLRISATRRFVNAQGQADVPELAPNQEIALFYAPTSGAIYQISVAPNDLALARQVAGANGATPATDPDAPAINLVRHDAARALKAGGKVTVTVRGTPGLRGTFDVSTRAQGQNLPLRETTPGVYTGVYTARVGDDVLNGRVTARLLGEGNVEERAQGEQPLTIDTVPPRIFGASPADQEALAGARPNVLVSADDIGGSGIARADAAFVSGQNRVEAEATVSPDGTISVVPNDDLQGATTLRLTVYDAAGNTAAGQFRYSVTPGAGEINSVTHNATVALGAGEVVTVVMAAEPNGRATFDVLAPDGRPVAQNVPMRQTDPGRYRGSYTVGENVDAASLRILGRFVGQANTTSTLEATQRVRLNAGETIRLSIDTPEADAEVTSPVRVSGKAAPNSLVEIAPRAEGTRTIAGIFGYAPYRDELPTTQVRADDEGNWTTTVTLPRKPRNVGGFRIVIAATSRNEDNTPTEPVEVSVTPRG